MTPPTTDTSREAVELACEHVETHERNLNNGFPMMCEIGMDIHALIAICRAVAEERDALVAERDAAILREKSLKDSTEELRQLQREFSAVKWDRDTLRDQLEAARNEALEEAAYQAQSACLVPPDGGAPTEEEAAVCDEAARRIRALKSTPSPRENCPECKGTGMCDSGGVHPWGECIEVPCDCSLAPREDSEDAELNKIADERQSGPFVPVSLDEATPQKAARVLLDIARERYTENAKTRVCQPVEPWDRISDDFKKMWLWAVCAEALTQGEQSDE